MQEGGFFPELEKVVWVVPFVQVGIAQITVGRNEVGLGGFHLFEQRNGLVVFAGDEENASLIGQDGPGRGIQCAGAFDLGERFGQAVERDEVGRIPVVSDRVVGIQFEGAAELDFGSLYVPHAEERDKGDGGVGVGGFVV